jgi:hypothetical protein
MKQLSILTIILLIAVSINFLYSQEGIKAEGIQLVEVKLGKDVKDRMIVDEDTTFALNSKVYLWMKVAGGTNEEIIVTWKAGEGKHETKLTIGGSPWRTWAVKNAFKSGDWTVTVTDNAGNVLKEMSFKVE